MFVLILIVIVFPFILFRLGFEKLTFVWVALIATGAVYLIGLVLAGLITWMFSDQVRYWDFPPSLITHLYQDYYSLSLIWGFVIPWVVSIETFYTFAWIMIQKSNPIVMFLFCASTLISVVIWRWGYIQFYEPGSMFGTLDKTGRKIEDYDDENIPDPYHVNPNYSGTYSEYCEKLEEMKERKRQDKINEKFRNSFW